MPLRRTAAQPLAAAPGVDLAANNVYLPRRNLVFGLIFVRSRLWAALQEIPQNSDSCRWPKRGELAINVSAKGTTMATGTVKFFNTQKGYGFIQPDDGSKDVFVHITAVEKAGMRSLVEGQKISFDIVTERGKQAAGNLQPA